MRIPDLHRIAAPITGAACLFIFFFMTGCRSTPVPPMAVVARVGEKLLTEDEIKAWESTLPGGKPSIELRSSFVRTWVEKELLLQAALERGIANDPWVESRLDDIRRELLTARLLELDAELQSPPTTREVIEYYEKHKDEFIWINVHLEVQYWRSTTRQTLDRLRLALTQSRPTPLQPEEDSSIDTGSFVVDDPGNVDPAIWRHFGWMSAGQLSYPVNYDGLFWILRVVRREEAGTQQKLDDVVDTITARIMVDARNRRRIDLVKRYAEQFRAEGRLQWTDPAMLLSEGNQTMTPK